MVIANLVKENSGQSLKFCQHLVIRDAKRAIRYAGHILELAIGTGNNYLSLKNDFDRDSNRLNKSCYSRVIKRGCFFGEPERTAKIQLEASVFY